MMCGGIDVLHSALAAQVHHAEVLAQEVQYALPILALDQLRTQDLVLVLEYHVLARGERPR